MKLTGPQWLVSGGAAAVIAIASVMGAHFEGTRTTAYQDIGGVWTICQGHTQGVQRGDTATDAQCRAYLQTDMGAAYATVNRCITAPLTIGAAAAFTDAAFNLGAIVVCGSTLQQRANAGDVAGACDELNRWNKVTQAGVKAFNQWQINRRAAEYALCVGGVR